MEPSAGLWQLRPGELWVTVCVGMTAVGGTVAGGRAMTMEGVLSERTRFGVLLSVCLLWQAMPE